MTDISRREVLQAGTTAAALFMLNESMASAQVSAPINAVPFRVAVPQAALDDLKRRLDGTRWPEHETEDGWAQGVPLDRLQQLVEYWRTHYNWRRFEAQINVYPQFREEIDGLGIHFLHVKSRHENALPIVLTHGWPGSVIEFLKESAP